MEKILNKFFVGSFLHHPQRGRIGLVLANSSKRQLVVRWLNGITQVVNLNPQTVAEQKQMARFERYHPLQLRDFAIKAGLPTRICKILHSDLNVEVVCESLAMPEEELDKAKLEREVLALVKLKESPDHTEVSTKKRGDLYRTLLRFWL